MEGKEETVGRNGLRIMSKTREDNKESSTETTHSCMSRIKLAFAAHSFSYTRSVIVAIYKLVWWTGYQ